MSEHHKIFAASYVILKKGEQVYLMRRANTSYADGKYSLPAGHLEQGESPSAAAIREAKEETGVDIVADDLRFVHTMHRAEEKEYEDFFFIAEKWQGEPYITEPEKCDDAGWYSLDALPENMIAYVRDMFMYIKENKFYSER